MRALRPFLLVLALFVAQLAAGGHAVDHAAAKGKALPEHVCQLCLTAHDLGAALPSLAALPAVVVPRFVPEVGMAAGRAVLPPPLAVQRGPPRA